jgi:tetratricopeptide (TPR) repeat protein
MTSASLRTSVFAVCALRLAATGAAQTVQYRSPAGIEYRSQADTGAIARAERALAADPRNVERFIELGVSQSNARQFREAIETFTRGLAVSPNSALLLRWRGHRYLSVREFDRALDDFTRGARLDSTIYGIWYHLGIVRYARGEFAAAADAFARAQPRAPDAAELAGATDWLWMSLSRAGRAAEARAMLARRPDSLPTANAYARRLKLYRGEIGPDELFTPADTADVQVATLAYGLGNWYLLRGDTARARASFERSVRSGGWPGFGFIISEIELQRLRGRASNPLQGTWRIVRYEIWETPGEAQHPLGPTPTGYVVFDETGRAFVQLMRAGDIATFGAYFGTYSLEPAANVVNIRVEGGNVPGYLATVQSRPFRVQRDTLVLGVVNEYRATFVRAAP